MNVWAYLNIFNCSRRWGAVKNVFIAEVCSSLMGEGIMSQSALFNFVLWSHGAHFAQFNSLIDLIYFPTKPCTHAHTLPFVILCQVPHPFFFLPFIHHFFSPSHPYFHFLSPLPDSSPLSQSTEFSGNPSQSLRRPFTLGGTSSPPVCSADYHPFSLLSSLLFSSNSLSRSRMCPSHF